MRWFVALLFCSFPIPLVAQPVGPQDVIPYEIQREIADCLRETRDSLSCYDHPQVTAAARALAQAIQANVPIGGSAILTEFREAGDVDVAIVFYPFLANTNEQWLFVNGPGGPVSVNSIAWRRDPPLVPSTRSILAQYPRAFESGRSSVAAVRHLPGGIQRFSVTDIVTDGCRGCAPVASSLRYVDFLNGQFSGLVEVGWRPWSDESLPELVQRLRAADVRALQDRLNTLGYNAGAVDGVAGPQTFEAFYAFKRDHCFPEDNQLSFDVIRALAPTHGNYDPGDCAPDVGDAVNLPESFPRGLYATTPQFCPAGSQPLLPEEDSFGRVIRISDDHWFRSESVCSIRNANISGNQAILALACNSEGQRVSFANHLHNITPNSFWFDGDTYRLCQEAEPSTFDIPAGQYAPHPAMCDGSLGAVPQAIIDAFGPRTMVIDPEFIAWDHSVCQINETAQSGTTYVVQSQCSYADDIWPATLQFEPFSDGRIQFDQFTLMRCDDAQSPATAETSPHGLGSPSYRTPEGSLWVVVASRPTIEEARTFAQSIGQQARIFEAVNGWYAITATILHEQEFDFLPNIIQSEGWPADSYLSPGDRFVSEVSLTSSAEPRAPAFTYTETLRATDLLSRWWSEDHPNYETVRRLPSGAPVVIWGEPDELGDCLVEGNAGVFVRCVDLAAFPGNAASHSTPQQITEQEIQSEILRFISVFNARDVNPLTSESFASWWEDFAVITMFDSRWHDLENNQELFSFRGRELIGSDLNYYFQGVVWYALTRSEAILQAVMVGWKVSNYQDFPSEDAFWAAQQGFEDASRLWE